MSKYRNSLEIMGYTAIESAVRRGTGNPAGRETAERGTSAIGSTVGRSMRLDLRDRASEITRKLRISPHTVAVLVLLAASSFQCAAQDNATTQNGSSGLNGAWINGPASNPLSFLNGPVARTTSSNDPYLLPDFRPVSQLNGELPRWLQFGLEERLRFEGYSNGGFKPGNSDTYLLNRLRILAIIRPTSWFKVVGEVQDARPFQQKPPIAPPNANEWDLKLAYAEFGDSETQRISVRAGRQIINYNNSLIGNSEWRNQARSYDAVVTNLRAGRYRLGIFAASVVLPLTEGVSHHQEGNNIYGLYGGIDNIVPNSRVEPFLLWRVAPGTAVETTAKVKTGRLDDKTYGFRFKGAAATYLDYTFEVAQQTGSAGSNNLRAWATQFGAGYRLIRLPWRPRAFGTYDYASGDKDPMDGKRGTFDTLSPNAHDRFGMSDQFGWQNIKSLRGGLTIEPVRRWSITGQYLNFYLASARDALYNTSGGAIARDATGKAGTHVGEEFDAYTWFELNRHVNIGAGIAHILPGHFLAVATKGAGYTYPFFAINFKDNPRVW
jgi:hypothetical protein